MDDRSFMCQGQSCAHSVLDADPVWRAVCRHSQLDGPNPAQPRRNVRVAGVRKAGGTATRPGLQSTRCRLVPITVCSCGGGMPFTAENSDCWLCERLRGGKQLVSSALPPRCKMGEEKDPHLFWNATLAGLALVRRHCATAPLKHCATTPLKHDDGMHYPQ